MTRDPAFLAAARRRPQLWRLALGLILAAAIYFALTSGALIAAAALSPLGPQAGAMLLVDGGSPSSMFVLLGTFGFMALGAWAAARLLHGRTFAELVGPARAVMRDAGLAGGVLLAINAPLLAAGLMTMDLAPNLAPGRWLTLLLPAAALVGLQTFAEELLFRGYLQGQLMARFARRAVWLAVPAVAFGLVHYDPELGLGPAWGIVAAATLFGLMAGDLTALTGRLGAAWGAHLANNWIALLLISADDRLGGLALLSSPLRLADAPWLLLIDAAVLAAAWWAIRRLLVRRDGRA